MTPTTASSGATGIATPYASIQMGKGTAVDKTSLGKEQFLNLLITQMRFQDPSAPMDSSQIMAQTSQMATVEQLTELTSTQREAFSLQMRLSASGFVGTQVSWTDETGDVQAGTVDSASFAGPVPVLNVGGRPVNLDQVSLVKAMGTAAAPVTPAKAATTT